MAERVQISEQRTKKTWRRVRRTENQGETEFNSDVNYFMNNSSEIKTKQYSYFRIIDKTIPDSVGVDHASSHIGRDDCG